MKAKRILGVIITFILIITATVATPQKVNAECFAEPSKGAFYVTYNDNGTIASIQVDFAFYDTKYKEENSNIGDSVGRFCNIVFTENAEKVNSDTGSTSPAYNWGKLGDSIYSDSAAKTVACTITEFGNVTVGSETQRLGLMEGSFTIDDSSLLGSLDSTKTYYALVMASWTNGSNGGTYYTSAHTTIDLAAYRHSVTFDYQGHGTNFVLPVKNNVSVNTSASTTNPDYSNTSIISSSVKNIIDNWETTVTNPKVTGYDFGGWYTNSSCTTGNEANFTNPINSKVTYYAKWTPHTHSWSYSASGATLQATSTCHTMNGCNYNNTEKNVELTLTATSPTYPASEGILGWKTGQIINFSLEGQADWLSTCGYSSLPTICYEGTGSTTYTKSAAKPTLAGTYKATITKNNATASVNFIIRQVYTVSVNANGGNGTMASTEVYPGNYTLPLCSIKPPLNKEFDGWALSSSGSKITTTTTYVSSNTTLYALWKTHTHRFTTTVLSDGITKDSCRCGFYIIKFE